MQVKLETPIVLRRVNPVRNSSGALTPAGMIIKPNPAAEQRGIISNGVKIIGPAGIREMDVVLDTGTVASIQMADIRAEAVDAICHDIPEITGIEGLLGFSFLKHFRTSIDYTMGVLEITPGK